MFIRQARNLLISRFRFYSRTPSSTYLSKTTSSTNASSIPLSTYIKFPNQYGPGFSTWWKRNEGIPSWILLSGQAAIILGINGTIAFAEDVPAEQNTVTEEAGSTGLRRIEDGSVISNIHTSKWRVFTDNGRDLFLQGKLEDAERLFLAALVEAKEGFGERDPHVASACNNLAELYRVKRAFDKAEPLYLEAINILEDSFGPEDVRVGAALHNLGQFYLVQRKLEQARICYERALKTKGRVLGHGHTDYADTMYHLGTVMYLQGKEKDSVALIQDSIRILEEGGQGDSVTCLRRLRYLAQVFINFNQLTDAENVQRKILHNLEMSKGTNSLETIVAAEGLALTLQAIGSLKEAQELLEWCLDARKAILKEDHIQIGANMLHLARVAMLSVNRLRKVNISEAKDELDNSRALLENSIRIAQQVLENHKQKGNNVQKNGVLKGNGKDERVALVILLQSLDALGTLEITRQELEEQEQEHPPPNEAAGDAFRQCISAFKQLQLSELVTNSPEVKAAYLTCLKHYLSFISDTPNEGTQSSRRNNTLKELKDEIKQVEAELSPNRKHRK